MSSPSPLRYVVGALAAAGAAALALAVLVGWCYVGFERVGQWADRQIWIVRVPTQCAIGLGMIYLLLIAWNAARAAWFHFVGAPAVPGETHGRHAKWRPGYTRPAPQAGACPRCGFTHAWDGTTCGHCKFGEQPTTNNQ